MPLSKSLGVLSWVYFLWFATWFTPLWLRHRAFLLRAFHSGFDVNEWIILDRLARPDVPMVMLNGNLDKVCRKLKVGSM